MARRVRRRSRTGTRGLGRTSSCKTVRVRGQGMRRICRDSKGRITSNKKASTTRRKRRR